MSPKSETFKTYSHICIFQSFKTNSLSSLYGMIRKAAYKDALLKDLASAESSLADAKNKAVQALATKTGVGAITAAS